MGGKTPQGVVDWYRDLAVLQVECAKDVWQQFPQYHETIEGFYTDLEENNLPDWYRSSKELSDHYLGPIAVDVKKLLSPDLKVWASPYAVYNWSLHNVRTLTSTGSCSTRPSTLRSGATCSTLPRPSTSSRR